MSKLETKLEGITLHKMPDGTYEARWGSLRGAGSSISEAMMILGVTMDKMISGLHEYIDSMKQCAVEHMGS